jgi:transposase-like protein
MEWKKFGAEFKVETVKQVVNKGQLVFDVANRLQISDSLLTARSTSSKSHKRLSQGNVRSCKLRWA